MAQISPDYASPGLRLGLLLHDHPDASYDFKFISGEELGVPAEFGGKGQFCLATIRFGDGRADASAWKPVPAKGNPDEWNIFQTKTLGRALKKAGYPDDLKDLKALVLWRQRSAEIGAIASGAQQLAISSTSAPASLEAGPSVLDAAFTAAAGSYDEDVQVKVSKAEVIAKDDSSDQFDDGELVNDSGVPFSDIETVAELVAGLDARAATNFKAYLKTVNIPSDYNYMSQAQIVDVMNWLSPDGE